MKNVVPVRFSLRKLLIATLALGPLAILPAPLWAALPTAASGNYVVTNGSGNVTIGNTSATNMTITSSVDKAVLVWNATKFNVASTDTWNFTIPAGGSILNKVGYNATTGALDTVDNAIIAGTLNSNGRVFVLANGNIVVGSGATLNAQGGLLLSTLGETSDFAFTTSGNLMLTGTSNAGSGNITIGNASSASVVTVGSGPLEVWAGNILTTNGITTTGDLILHGTLLNGPMALASGNLAITVGGNLTVVTNNGAVTQNSAVLVANGTTSVKTTGNALVTLGAANDFKTFTANVGNATAGGSVTIVDINDVVLGASTVGNILSVTAAGNITTSGAVAVGNATAGAVVLASGTAGNITYASGSSGGALLNATTANGPITVSTVGNLTTGTIMSSTGNAISLTSGNVLTFAGTASTATTPGSVTGTAVSINSTASGAIAGPASIVTLTSTAGGLVLPAITSANIVATSTGGSITQNASTILTTSGNSTFNAGANDVTISKNNVMTGATLTLTGNNITVGNSKDITLGTTNATNNLTVNTTWSGTSGNVTLGSLAGSAATNVIVGNALVITTNSSQVVDNDQYSSVSVGGNVSINTTAAGTGALVSLNASSNSVQSGTGTFGVLTIKAGVGNVTVAESAQMDLGVITGNAISFATAGTGPFDLNIGNTITTTAATTGTASFTNGSGGNISETGAGNLQLASTSGVATFTTTNTTGINLSNTSNSFLNAGIALAGGNNDIVVSNTTLASISPVVTAGSLSVSTLNAGNNITVASGTNVASATFNSAGNITLAGGKFKNVTLISADTGNAITQTGAITLNGTMSITAGNNVTLSTATNNITGSVAFVSTGGDAAVTSNRNLTVSGTVGGALALIAGSNGAFANTWSLSLGNLNVKSLTANVLNGVNNAALSGNSGSISQLAGTNLHSDGPASFVTFNGDIIVANSGNSNSRVDFATGGTLTAATGTGNITYLEDPGIKLGNVLTQGVATITSALGSIVEDGVGQTNMTVTGSSSRLNLSAANGAIALGGLTSGATTVGNVTNANITASGAAALKTTVGNLALGSIAANSLTINASDSAAGKANITQNGPFSIYGTASFTSKGNITLTNNANNFGPIVLNSTVADKNISITESNTMNLRTVSMASGTIGNFTATSVNADIITSGFGGVKPGGIVGGAGTGVVTLVASNGNITVGDATTDFPTTGGVVFNAKNVSISVLGGANLTLGAANTTSVAGNLTVTSATGNVMNAGPLSVTGLASFQSGTQSITLGQPANQFGSLKFTGNTVNIAQANSMAIATGSASGVGSSPGSASLSSGGNITISNVGGQVSFGGTSFLYATGNITLPKLISAGGTMTVNAAGTKDLSALSLSSDLGGFTPVNLGTGAYSAPQP